MSIPTNSLSANPRQSVYWQHEKSARQPRGEATFGKNSIRYRKTLTEIALSNGGNGRRSCKLENRREFVAL
jgi:hypothetical protein